MTGTRFGPRFGLLDIVTVAATTAVGITLARSAAPTLFTRSTSNLGGRLALIAVIMTPSVVLGATALLILRGLLPRLRRSPPVRLLFSIVVLGVVLLLAVELTAGVMRVVVALAE